MKVNPHIKNMDRDALEQLASKLYFCSHKYEDLLLSLVGKEAFTHFSKHLGVELMRADAEEMEEGEEKNATLEKIEQLDLELVKEAADNISKILEEMKNNGCN